MYVMCDIGEDFATCMYALLINTANRLLPYLKNTVLTLWEHVTP